MTSNRWLTGDIWVGKTRTASADRPVSRAYGFADRAAGANLRMPNHRHKHRCQRL